MSDNKLQNDLDSLTIIEENKQREVSSSEKVLEILLQKKDINLKTELSDKEILEISKLQVISSKIGSENLANFLIFFKELRVSKNRQGRKEIIGAIQDDDTKKSGGFFDQFMNDMMGKRPM